MTSYVFNFFGSNQVEQPQPQQSKKQNNVSSPNMIDELKSFDIKKRLKKVEIKPKEKNVNPAWVEVIEKRKKVLKINDNDDDNQIVEREVYIVEKDILVKEISDTDTDTDTKNIPSESDGLVVKTYVKYSELELYETISRLENMINDLTAKVERLEKNRD